MKALTTFTIFKKKKTTFTLLLPVKRCKMNHVKETFAPIFTYSGGDVTSSSSSTPNKTKMRKLVCFFFFPFFLVHVGSFPLVAAAAERGSANDVLVDHAAAHAIIKSSCSSTLYPELCVSAISAGGGGLAAKIKNPRDVIEASLNLTVTAVQHNYFTIRKLIAVGNKTLTKHELTGLRDCLELVDETLDELFKAEEDVRGSNNNSSSSKSISQHADHLKILLSGAMTNQKTCLDEFSPDTGERKVREALIAGQMHVYHMCSNALAMIRNITNGDMANKHYSPAEQMNGTNGWPHWLSAGDRRLLQAPTVTPDVVVAADGSGNYRTVSEAVAAAPDRSSRRYIIKIKAGVYRENVDVPKKKTNLMFVGDGRVNTIITGNRNVVDGSTTFHSATVGEFNPHMHNFAILITLHVSMNPFFR